MNSDVFTVPQHKKLNSVIPRESVLNKRQKRMVQTETDSRVQLRQKSKKLSQDVSCTDSWRKCRYVQHLESSLTDIYYTLLMVTPW